MDWNRCDVCGRFVGFDDIDCGKAVRKLDTPDSHFTHETWTTLCPDHLSANKVPHSGEE